jgi:hypothetical protein
MHYTINTYYNYNKSIITMFSFNKYDIIKISKINDILINVEYTDMRTYEIYKNDINLEKDVSVIDDYDLLCKYMEKLETEKHKLIFKNFIDEFTGSDIIQLTIPFKNAFKKASSDIILELPKIISLYKHDPINDLLLREIKLLKKNIADNFVIPFISDVCSTEITDDVTDDILLENINKYAVTFCKEQYYIDDSQIFKIVEWCPTQPSKCIMLHDAFDKPVIKYGCNYLCFVENKIMKIMRIPTYELLNGMTICGYVTISRYNGGHHTVNETTNLTISILRISISAPTHLFRLSVKIEIDRELPNSGGTIHQFANVMNTVAYNAVTGTNRSLYYFDATDSCTYFNNMLSSKWAFDNTYTTMRYNINK